jgi:multiple sugar transport system permease protein
MTTQRIESHPERAPSSARGRGSILPRLSRLLSRHELVFYLFISPWAIGFIAFTLGPFLVSLWLSMTEWDLVTPPQFVGFSNFRRMFIDDRYFWVSLWNTVYYTIVSVPLKQIIAFTLAMLLNQDLKGIYIYRTIFYLPSVTSGVATAILWMYVFGYHTGVVNAVLKFFSLGPYAWFTDMKLAMPTLIFISLWEVGNLFLIYLAGLQGVPRQLYEAAEVDGAGRLRKIWNVTIPMITPTVFFNLVMGFIQSFQVFTSAFIITEGGPADRTLFYVLRLYREAFTYFRMGYASALAWVLFMIILLLSLIQLRLSRRWVYYEGAVPVVGARA